VLVFFDRKTLSNNFPSLFNTSHSFCTMIPLTLDTIISNEFKAGRRQDVRPSVRFARFANVLGYSARTYQRALQLLME
jgi:hypothetical protein